MSKTLKALKGIKKNKSLIEKAFGITDKRYKTLEAIVQGFMDKKPTRAELINFLSDDRRITKVEALVLYDFNVIFFEYLTKKRDGK